MKLRRGLRWHRVEVRFDPDFDGDNEERWEPPVASRHDEIFESLSRDGGGWSSIVLRQVLQHVKAGNVIEQIAVLDAWLPDETSLCVVYWSPFADNPVGLRRVLADRDPDATPFVSDKVRMSLKKMFDAYPEAAADWLLPPREPSEFAGHLVEWMSQPLGIWSHHLRYDANGLGWWGTLEASLPQRP